MILQPSILALLFSSLLICLMMIWAACFGIVILRRWDISSGSQLQLALERRTYLVSTIVGYFLAFQLVSLFLFIRTADGLSQLFVGAMCAVGTLTVNPYGSATLLLKVVTFVLAGLWLIVNRADSLGYDYPLIRAKYRLLLLAAPLVLAETVTQALYFLGLKPDVITSCCGTLFSNGARGAAAQVLALPLLPIEAGFVICTLLTIAAGARFLLMGEGGYLFAALSGIQFPVSIASIISFISLYIYEMPSHHCPFCLLQKEYGYLGYPLYGLLLAAVVSGVAVGVLQPFRGKESLKDVIPSLQRKLAAASLISLLIFTFLVAWQIFSSNLKHTPLI